MSGDDQDQRMTSARRPINDSEGIVVDCVHEDSQVAFEWSSNERGEEDEEERRRTRGCITGTIGWIDNSHGSVLFLHTNPVDSEDFIVLISASLLWH